MKANQRIMAWLEGRPYQEHPDQRFPKVPNLTPEVVLKTFTPAVAEQTGQFFTPLEAGLQALKGMGLWDDIQVLEPCAGIGHLIHCLSTLAGPVYLNVTAYEIADLPYRIGARLFSWVDWRQTNVFYQAANLAGRFDLVMCHPPFRGSAHLGPKDISGWHAGPTQTEYLFLELAARALKPGGRAVFIAPAPFAEAMPVELKAYLEEAGFGLTGRSEEPLPGDFTEPKAPNGQTGVRVHAFYWYKAGG
jgi:SAM-dependent methyltransferase